MVGFTYESDRPRIYYVDEEEAALQKSIDAGLPPGNLNRIVDRADEDKYIVIRSKGPREPGRYYLLKDKTSIEAIGHAAAVEPEQLGEKRAIWYTARDGRRIHAILTLPPFGEPPYPAVVNPHGGPSSRDGLFWNGAWWDEWPQLLATRGYAVLQPNFRGSTGYGTEHFRAGAGEWGLAMQDDMDDGMLHLVREGIADPERMAIFGWSYGGYAAMVGSLREPNIYRCSIPGAGVSSMDLIRKEEWRHRFSEVLQRSRGGVSPIELVDRVNVPVLLVHGDRDLIVDIKHSDLFAAELKKHGKPYRYVRLIDAAHTVDTLGYEHLMEFYPAMLDFLADDCGFRTGSASR
ncbi:MAG: S9 family peptidase [Proteobacteria bacterium]|nr:S9 family peptidase [Pseudomonadota bacterium]